MKFFVGILAVLSVIQSGFGEEIRLLDLEPTDAQQYIEKQDTSLKYAPKIESNVPAVRYLGKEPHNVLEDIYLANQYHGQDGLGAYLYGYSVPDIAKTEKKQAGGDLRGSYNYITGDGQEIKVEYWDDGTGFHQVDNVPKILPQQIEDTPEVKAAREEHFRIWQEEAARNARPVEDPHAGAGQGQPQYGQGQAQYGQQSQQQLVNQYQQQKQQYPNPGQSVQYQGDQASQYQAQSSQAVGQYQTAQYQGQSAQSSSQNQQGSAQYGGGQQNEGQYKAENEEEQGPPRGFFYNFDYPVGIIVQKQGAVQKRESDVKDVYATNKAEFEQQLQSGARSARSSSGYLYIPKN